MNNELKIAIIHPGTLAAIGLKQMMQEVMPVVVVDTYRSTDELAGNDCYIHYFAAANAVAANMQFFAERRRKTIVLNATAETPSPFAGFHNLCTSVPEKQLVRSLLSLEQAAHAHGRNMPPTPQQQAETQLSPREIEVMTLIVKGLINKEIASRLNISLATVITHRHNIMEKLALRSVSALTIYAVTRGYVDISEI